jgi:hypothetical protein
MFLWVEKRTNFPKNSFQLEAASLPGQLSLFDEWCTGG